MAINKDMGNRIIKTANTHLIHWPRWSMDHSCWHLLIFCFGGNAKIKLDVTDQSHDVVLLLAEKWMMSMRSAYAKIMCSGHPKVVFGNTRVSRALHKNHCTSVLDSSYPWICWAQHFVNTSNQFCSSST